MTFWLDTEDPEVLAAISGRLQEIGADPALAHDVALAMDAAGCSIEEGVTRATVVREFLHTPIEETQGGIPNWMLEAVPDFPPSD